MPLKQKFFFSYYFFLFIYALWRGLLIGAKLQTEKYNFQINLRYY
ncbi:hypothetical protein CAPSP0001_0135 [Capnocytophaga sputigena ATCC 33612]|nr:hypothetical protein CAPSP0001_0135 [Capnocytophaga sputigena ATCC 33612]